MKQLSPKRKQAFKMSLKKGMSSPETKQQGLTISLSIVKNPTKEALKLMPTVSDSRQPFKTKKPTILTTKNHSLGVIFFIVLELLFRNCFIYTTNF